VTPEQHAKLAELARQHIDQEQAALAHQNVPPPPVLTTMGCGCCMQNGSILRLCHTHLNTP
jgi:hypothetical protein